MSYLYRFIVLFSLINIDKCCICTSPEANNAAMQQTHGLTVEFEGKSPNVLALLF